MADIFYNNAYWPGIVTCEKCGKTARPVHRYPLPPEKVFCPFCDEEVPLVTERVPEYNANVFFRAERIAKDTNVPSNDTISRQAALDCFHDWADKRGDVHAADEMPEYRAIEALPPAGSGWEKDLIQQFHDYQVEWLTNHYDLAREPELEKMIARFLHDTANSFMMVPEP